MAITTPTVPTWYGSPGLSSTYSIGVSGYGAGGYSSTTTPYTATTTVAGTLTAGDVMIDGVSMKESIKAINERLAILVPDLEKMEKYATLKEIYLQYKVVEALIGNDKDSPKIE